MADKKQKKSMEKMDELRAHTDLKSGCNGDGQGNNPLIPPGGSCEINDPVDPKLAPAAQGTPIANQKGGNPDHQSRKDKASDKAEAAGEKAKESAEAAKEKAGQAADTVKEKAGDAAETVKEKAGDAAESLKEKAAQGKAFIGEKIDEATADVDERPHEDSFVFAENVIEKIAGIAAREIKGILALKSNIISGLAGNIMGDENTSADPKQGVDVEIGGDQVVVSLKAILEYGAPAPEIFNKLRSHIGRQLAVMTGLELVELNVEVIDVMTREEFERAAQSRFNTYEREPERYINRYAESYDDRRGGRPDGRGYAGPRQAPQGPQGFGGPAPQGGYQGNF